MRRLEIAAIARFLGIPRRELMARYVRKVLGEYSLVEEPNGDCVFWAPEGCRIYPVRPIQCRTFPFWREYTRSPEAWARAAERCPGVNKGRLYSAAEIAHLVEITDA